MRCGVRCSQLDSRIEQMESESHDRRRLQRAAPTQTAEEPTLRTWAWEAEGASLLTRVPSYHDLTVPGGQIWGLSASDARSVPSQPSEATSWTLEILLD